MNLNIEEDASSANFGDLTITARGQLELVRAQEEIAQHVSQRLRTFFSEWFLDTSLGIPYFDEVFEKGQDLEKIDALFIAAILETPGVVRLLDFSLDVPDAGERRLSISFKAQTLDSLEPLVVDDILIP